MRLQFLICYLWIRSKIGKIYVQTKTYSKKDNHYDWVWWMIQLFESQVLRVSERLYFFPEISNRWWVYLDTLLPHRRHFTVFGACNQEWFLPAPFLRWGQSEVAANRLSHDGQQLSCCCSNYTLFTFVVFFWWWLWGRQQRHRYPFFSRAFF